RLAIPPDSSLIKQILHEFHDSYVGGHAGITITTARIASQFSWPQMKQNISDYIKHCAVYQQAKHTTNLPVGLLSPSPIPSRVWEDVAMDFITGLPNSCGFTVILVVVDRLTKYSHFFPLKSDYDSKSVAEIFMKNIVKLYGIPKSIVSDCDKVFTRRFWQHLFKLQGTTLAMSSAYHPQSDGQNEALNNAAMTPLKALYGRDPPNLTRSMASIDSLDEAVQSHVQSKDFILSQLQQNLHKAQQVMKKLSLKYFGPFAVVAKIGSVAYKLALPPSARIHPVFHVSQLKKFHTDERVPYSSLPITTSELGPLMLPDKVLKHRTILQGPNSVNQVLVQWQGLEAALATWEDTADMLMHFPNFNLEDKIDVNGGSNVRNMANNEQQMIDNDEDKMSHVVPYIGSTRDMWPLLQLWWK
ncbi:Ty3/gypsy retrotransposon protein, partial [Trifolium pratense]